MKYVVFILFFVLSIKLIPIFYMSRQGVAPKNSVTKEAATIIAISGSDLKQITLTAEAYDRLGIQTAAVRDINIASKSGNTIIHADIKTVPYSSVIYDLDGKTWLYVQSKPLLFTRSPIKINYIEGPSAVVSEGPLTGTNVVTVGVPELYGIETGIKK